VKGIFNQLPTHYLVFHIDNLPFYYVARQASIHDKRVTFPRQYLSLFSIFPTWLNRGLCSSDAIYSMCFSLTDRRMTEIETKFITVMPTTHLEQLHVSISGTLTINIWCLWSNSENHKRQKLRIMQSQKISESIPSPLNTDRRISPFLWLRFSTFLAGIKRSPSRLRWVSIRKLFP
jgi:hypothetical protein